MNEKEWQRQVIEAAEILGWRVMHVRTAIGRRGGAHAYQTPTSIDGWPDLFLWNVRRPEKGCIAIELKSDTGRVRPEQVQVLAELHAAGIRTMIARPGDIDTVIDLLRA